LVLTQRNDRQHEHQHFSIHKEQRPHAKTSRYLFSFDSSKQTSSYADAVQMVANRLPLNTTSSCYWRRSFETKTFFASILTE